MKRQNTVELVLKSPLCEERVEVPAPLWRDFKKKAKELHMTPEELFPMALRAFILGGEKDGPQGQRETS